LEESCLKSAEGDKKERKGKMRRSNRELFEHWTRLEEGKGATSQGGREGKKLSSPCTS